MNVPSFHPVLGRYDRRSTGLLLRDWTINRNGTTLQQPPGARRATSAGLSNAAASNFQQPTWESGTPLPPPPSSSQGEVRSQSTGRVSTLRRTDRMMPGRSISDSYTSLAQGGSQLTALGSVPPTPVGWTEHESDGGSVLPIHGVNVSIMSAFSEDEPESQPSCYQAARALEIENSQGSNPSDSRSLIREPSMQRIRERRSASCISRERSASMDRPIQEAIQPATSASQTQLATPLVLVLPTPSALARTRHAKKAKTSPLLAKTAAPPTSPCPDSGYTSSSDNFQNFGSPQCVSASPPEISQNSVEPMKFMAGRSTSKTRSFANEATARHHVFVEQEATANSDEGKIRLFIAYMKHEWELRQTLYPVAAQSLAEELTEYSNCFWGVPKTQPCCNILPNDAMNILMAPAEVSLSSPMNASSQSQKIPADDGENRIDGIPDLGIQSESCGSGPPQCQLCSIPAEDQCGVPPCLPPDFMALSTAHEDIHDRGRPSSRWWEASAAPGSTETSRKAELTAEATEYSGLPTKSVEDIQTASGILGHDLHERSPPDLGEQPALWKQDNSGKILSVLTPKTSQSAKLDISRLITLPPPYPWCNPALKNNHPELQEYRVILEHIKDRSHLDASLDNLAPNQDFSQDSFNVYRTQVMLPRKATTKTRLNAASKAMSQLCDLLDREAWHLKSTQGVEHVGDQSGLLEKLSLLRWLADACEQLYKDLFDLKTENDARYEDVVLSSYLPSKQESKAGEVRLFFIADGKARFVRYRREALERVGQLHERVGKHVTDGVQALVSAFSNTAPLLQEVIERVPTEALASFEVDIPQHEYADNPSYAKFPLQYLLTLLLRPERASYQFIEAQIDLLCLLDEVKTAVVTARQSLSQAEKMSEGSDLTTVTTENENEKKEYISSGELDEQIKLAKEQWHNGLGRNLITCRENVKRFLVGQGAWNEGLV